MGRTGSKGPESRMSSAHTCTVRCFPRTQLWRTPFSTWLSGGATPTTISRRSTTSSNHALTMQPWPRRSRRNMDSIATLHTHNTYCDGKSSIEDMVRAAIDAGLTTIGISSHAPLPFQTDWTMKPERLGEYIEAVRQLASKYAGRIRVLAALEGDFIPDERVLGFHAERIVPLGFDYFIGSVHFLGDDYPPQSFDGNEEEFRHLLD